MEKWFRITLLATAVMNICGALTFVPANRSARAMLSVPEPHPMYLWILAIWIFAFGLCYLWMAVTQSRERLFIVIGAIGKLSFFGVLAVCSITGELPFQTTLAGVGDFIFGLLFVWWLVKHRNDVR